MALTPIGLNVPAGTDAFDPQVDFGDLATSLIGRTVVPVANVTARAALATLVAPTSSKPLVVFRADATAGQQIEYSTNGSTWTTVGVLAPAVPYAQAQGLASATLTAVSVFNIAVTFPAGRFTVPPLVQTTIQGAPANGTRLVPRANQGTTSGCNVVLYHGDGTPMTAGVNVGVAWHAIQMTSSAAAG